MKIPEEMRERINANGKRIWLLAQEIEMLGIETDKLFAIAQELTEQIEFVCQEDKETFGKWAIHWYRRHESYLKQHEMVMLEIRTKADELNDLTGGLWDLRREHGETDEDVLSGAILYLNEDGIH